MHTCLTQPMRPCLAMAVHQTLCICSAAAPSHSNLYMQTQALRIHMYVYLDDCKICLCTCSVCAAAVINMYMYMVFPNPGLKQQHLSLPMGCSWPAVINICLGIICGCACFSEKHERRGRPAQTAPSKGLQHLPAAPVERPEG